ncbi:chloride channel protein [Pseudoramibacter alactolyticus]|mgnify:CR=1 FL=1|nr:ClC family H(+)/Cl(-) exchange transporter [Pseudoramibacter alactolyticus]
MQRQSQKTLHHMVEDHRIFSARLAGEGALVGVVAGLVAVAYRRAMDWSLSFHMAMLRHMHSWWTVAVFSLLLAGMAMVVARLIRWEPWIRGSGISEVSGELRGYLDMCWWRVLVAKLAGSLLGIVGGLSLGREGPSVQLGAMAGKGFSRTFRRDELEERYLVTCGAGAGLSAAFNCPLSGVMFALETFYKDYSLNMLFSVMTAAVVADFVSKVFFGMNPVFRIPVQGTLGLSEVWLVLLLGIFCGLTGALFHQCLKGSGRFYSHLRRLPREYHPVIPFLLAGMIGFVLPEVLGDGHVMLEDLGAGVFGFRMIVMLFTVKFLFSMLCFSSGAPGGSLAPMMVLGGFVGGIYGHLAVMHFSVAPRLINNFVILAMAGYFAAIVRAPLTAVVLASELTGSLNHLIYVGAVVIISELTAALIKTEPLFEAGLGRLIAEQRSEEHRTSEGQSKVLVMASISLGSVLDQAAIASVAWPPGSLVVSVQRGNRELTPNGDTVLVAGDRLVLICDQDQRIPAAEALKAMTDGPAGI